VGVKLIASIAGFMFIALAVMFGQAFSPDASNALMTVGSISAFVAGTAFVLGVVFGRAGLVVAIFSGFFALIVVSLPQLYYATTESLSKYAVVLLLLLVLMSASSFFGTCLRRKVMS
jgi:hypothetical protein